MRLKFLQSTLVERVPELTWMDAGTKNRTKAKILEMVMNLGYPDFVVNTTELDATAVNVAVVANETIWQTYQKYLKQDVEGYATMLSHNRSRFGWSYADVSEVNAGYKAASNNLEFPAGILQRPLFHPAFPKFWNFGSVASVLGHEMSHGFDKSGSQFDGQGLEVNWWSAESAANFQRLGGCMVDFYSRYEIEGIRVNGNLTLDENIADVGGLSLAFRSYRRWKELAPVLERRRADDDYEAEDILTDDEGDDDDEEEESIDVEDDDNEEGFPLRGISLTDEQLFFVAFGQTWCEAARRQQQLDAVKTWEHCPQPARTEAAIALIPEFARVFHCRPRSKMNPEKRCDLW